MQAEKDVTNYQQELSNEEVHSIITMVFERKFSKRGVIQSLCLFALFIVSSGIVLFSKSGDYVELFVAIAIWVFSIHLYNEVQAYLRMKILMKVLKKLDQNEK